MPNHPPRPEPTRYAGDEPAVEVGDDLQRATQAAIRDECRSLERELIEKNRKYGNSALDPVRVFSDASPSEQLKVRIDDKLSRVRSSQTDEDEDVTLDLMGYLILYRVARRLRSSG